ncbi:beta-ketoacyl synthase N-terminal-like domain-containing protein [Eudoraea chungangensis]|uniref:beta-ketoacyl synthase N-terminal-like domain-containing protein n=1 Tax=Eudoraea chungangensis TaxID=1481905 RepID=UPI0023EC6590|nr:beta-ketoacyl synthase N-terminal-like domain-containing protein [Eudoraea chungangensis]
MQDPITVSSIATISSLGFKREDVWNSYSNEKHCLSEQEVLNKLIPVSKLPKSLDNSVLNLRASHPKYRNLDRTVLLGILVARKAVEKAEWDASAEFGINMGSSRGATELFEKYLFQYRNSNRASVFTSPTTTLGNISSWIAHDLGSKGPNISHSITCSSALHALLNGVAWLRSGMADRFLIGGTEAPLTPFTIAQMQALKIYSPFAGAEYPCKALDLEKEVNSMVLGEGAGVACLELGITKNTLAIVEGVGYATELLSHGTSLSANAKCIQDSMSMALKDIDASSIDCIVMHAPGTIKGDMAEYKAIEAIFGKDLPALTSNKWKVGHTFGASGILSLDMAIMMIKHQHFFKVPYLNRTSEPARLNRILINAVGFGGNAVSVVIKAI